MVLGGKSADSRYFFYGEGAGEEELAGAIYAQGAEAGGGGDAAGGEVEAGELASG